MHLWLLNIYRISQKFTETPEITALSLQAEHPGLYNILIINIIAYMYVYKYNSLPLYKIISLDVIKTTSDENN